MNNRLYRFLIHLSIWILYFFYENGAVLIIDPKSVFLLSSAFFFILNAMIFYLNYYVLKSLSGKLKFKLWSGIFVSLLIIYLAANYGLTNLIHFWHIPTIMQTSPFGSFIVLRLFRYMYLMTISFTYWLVLEKIAFEKKMRVLEFQKVLQAEKALILQKEKLSAELYFLKSQISPHFLFNTLSFIYGQVIKYSEKAGESIILLSDIMRYALASPEKDGLIGLDQEIKHIRNLINIHQLRFNDKLEITLNVPTLEDAKQFRILPFLIITFIENVFKYGNLTNEHDPVIIQIDLTDNDIYFYLRNTKSIKSVVSENVGFEVGINNIKERLRLTYASNCYNLNISNEKQVFTVNLNLSNAKTYMYNSR